MYIHCQWKYVLLLVKTLFIEDRFGSNGRLLVLSLDHLIMLAVF